MKKAFWNDRYRRPEFIYGQEPNDYIRQFIDHTPPGHILFPGEGEGRNAVYAARKNWRVSAFDQSEAARTKALGLARKNGVQIDYQLCDVQDFPFTENTYDAIALSYFHLPAQLRPELHAKLISSLQPGGQIVLEMFSKEQLQFHSGGPKKASMLYSLSEIREDFASMEMSHLEQKIVILEEGPLHRGEASVLRMTGRKSLS